MSPPAAKKRKAKTEDEPMSAACTVKVSSTLAGDPPATAAPTPVAVAKQLPATSSATTTSSSTTTTPTAIPHSGAMDLSAEARSAKEYISHKRQKHSATSTPSSRATPATATVGAAKTTNGIHPAKKATAAQKQQHSSLVSSKKANAPVQAPPLPVATASAAPTAVAVVVDTLTAKRTTTTTKAKDQLQAQAPAQAPQGQQQQQQPEAQTLARAPRRQLPSRSSLLKDLSLLGLDQASPPRLSAGEYLMYLASTDDALTRTVQEDRISTTTSPSSPPSGPKTPSLQQFIEVPTFRLCSLAQYMREEKKQQAAVLEAALAKLEAEAAANAAASSNNRQDAGPLNENSMGVSTRKKHKAIVNQKVEAVIQATAGGSTGYGTNAAGAKTTEKPTPPGQQRRVGGKFAKAIPVDISNGDPTLALMAVVRGPEAEDLTDEVFEKRHRKQEMAEKKVKNREKEKLQHDMYQQKLTVEKLKHTDANRLMPLQAFRMLAFPANGQLSKAHIHPQEEEPSTLVTASVGDQPPVEFKSTMQEAKAMQDEWFRRLLMGAEENLKRYEQLGLGENIVSSYSPYTRTVGLLDKMGGHPMHERNVLSLQQQQQQQNQQQLGQQQQHSTSARALSNQGGSQSQQQQHHQVQLSRQGSSTTTSSTLTPLQTGVSEKGKSKLSVTTLSRKSSTSSATSASNLKAAKISKTSSKTATAAVAAAEAATKSKSKAKRSLKSSSSSQPSSSPPASSATSPTSPFSSPFSILTSHHHVPSQTARRPSIPKKQQQQPSSSSPQSFSRASSTSSSVSSLSNRRVSLPPPKPITTFFKGDLVGFGTGGARKSSRVALAFGERVPTIERMDFDLPLETFGMLLDEAAMEQDGSINDHGGGGSSSGVHANGKKLQKDNDKEEDRPSHSIMTDDTISQQQQQQHSDTRHDHHPHHHHHHHHHHLQQQHQHHNQQHHGASTAHAEPTSRTTTLSLASAAKIKNE